LEQDYSCCKNLIVARASADGVASLDKKVSCNIALAGFMGVGKSTVGKLVAHIRGCDFIDTDVEIEQREGMSISRIFERHGENYFREKERALVRELTKRKNIVVATGGGTIVNDENRRVLLENFLCVVVTATPDAILKRIGEDAAQARPMLHGDDVKSRIAHLLNERKSRYAELHYHIDTTDKTPEAVAEIVAQIAESEQMRIEVELDQRYPIILGDGMLDQLGYLLAGRGYAAPAAIISDKIVASHYAGRVSLALKAAGIASFVFTIPHGEQHKNLATVESMYRALSEHGMERNSPVIALGGGVVGDAAGYAAATYLRGIPFVQVPTSLLAMVDSSIGGKTGVDTAFGKNLVGAFKQPDLVVIDTQCLLTLPVIELRCGYAEIIKGALIKGGSDFELVRTHLPNSRMRGAEEYFHTGENGYVDAVMMDAMVNKILLKREIVQDDPFEKNKRAWLNLGHTFGHGIEQWSNYEIKHGQAISLGLVCALRLSQKIGLCESSLVDDVISILDGVGLPTDLSAFKNRLKPVDVDAVWQIMQSDKKKRAGKLRFVLIRKPGDVFVHDGVNEDDAKEAILALMK
jgi:3-dehydroquinate synthase